MSRYYRHNPEEVVRPDWFSTLPVMPSPFVNDPHEGEKEPDEHTDTVKETMTHSQWQTMESAPTGGFWVLLWSPCDGYDIGSCHKGHWYAQGFDSSGYDIQLTPTHWMPLPEAPQ